MSKNSTKTLIAAATLAVLSTSTLAGGVDFDAALDFPGSSNLNGIVGTGISNANFVRMANGGVEIGLKTIERFQGDLSNTNEVYTATAGTSTSSSGLLGSTWNYVLAVDLGDKTISDFQIDLLLDFDAAEDATDYVNLDITGIFESQQLGGLSTFGDSQNFLFNFWQTDFGAPAFDPFATGEYEMRLSVRDRVTDAVVAEVFNTVNVVPLPPAAFAGLGLLGSLAGVRAIRRR